MELDEGYITYNTTKAHKEVRPGLERKCKSVLSEYVSYWRDTGEDGIGFTMKEVIDVAGKVTGHPIPAEICPRRAGDPAQLAASSEKAKAVLESRSTAIWRPSCEPREIGSSAIPTDMADIVVEGKRQDLT